MGAQRMGGKANVTALTARSRRVLSLAAVMLGCGPAVGVLIAAPGAAAATDYGQGRRLAVVAHASGAVEVYWRGAEGYLWEKAESGGQWQGAVRTPIGGLASSPAATIGSHGYDYVFWEGSNGDLLEAANSRTGWLGPTDLGMGPLGSQPTATSIPNSSGVAEIDVFWHGNQAGANLWRASYLTATGKWSGPSEIGGMGPLGSPPTATEQQTSAGAQIQVYWKGDDGALWEADTSGGTKWSGPTSHGMGPLGSSPAVASSSYGNENVFWGGTFGRLWQANWDSTSWNGVNLNGPISVGFGPMASAPTVAAAAPNEYDVFWVGTDSDLWEAQLVSQTWTSVQSRGPMVAAQTAPAPVTVPQPPKAHGRRRRVRVAIKMHWTYRGIHTWLDRIQFGRLPAGATIRVACHGRDCPRRHWSTAKRRLRTLARSLERHRFRAGQRLTITISVRGWISERAGVRIRNGALPTAKLL